MTSVSQTKILGHTVFAGAGGGFKCPPPSILLLVKYYKAIKNVNDKNIGGENVSVFYYVSKK